MPAHGSPARVYHPCVADVATSSAAAAAVVAEVVRSGMVEGRHRGSVVALGPEGHVVLALGDPGAAIFPRSSNKPLQAAGMLDHGLAIDADASGELLALVAASHNGEDFHLEGVRRILVGAGLDESALQTPADLPLSPNAQATWHRAGRPPAPVAMNCSGKHAGMLATCVAAGWPTATYREPGHPLQLVLRAKVEELAGEQVCATGVDGCGAPLFALTLLGLARAFRAMALAGPGSSACAVALAMRAHPAYVGGTGRDVTALMEAVPGLLAKDGAEGVYAAALPDGRAVALKIEDGAGRARPPVLVAALRRLGVAGPALDHVASTPLYGGSRQVGEIRATF